MAQEKAKARRKQTDTAAAAGARVEPPACSRCGSTLLDLQSARRWQQTLVRRFSCVTCGAPVSEMIEIKPEDEKAVLGIICGYCGRNKWHVRDTDNLPDGTVRRYRICLNCGRSKTTAER